MWFETDVSGLHTGLIFKSQAWSLKMGPIGIGSPETSVSDHATPPKNLEHGGI